MKMKLTNTKVIEGILENIELIHQLMSGIVKARTYLQERSKTSVSDEDMYSLLVEAENNEWGKLAAWALSMDNKTRDRIKAAVHARYLSMGSSVMEWINPGGIPPSMWMKADEDKFREMARQHFAPKDSK